MDSNSLIVLIVILIVTPLWWTFVRKSRNNTQENNNSIKGYLKEGFVLARYVILILSALVLLYFAINMYLA
ncbi:MAG TPA: hypothetical protein DCX64_05980 [Gammaproteobacteria bacterium]|nr:hypothetical protein [Gammaproteobacteria bacterium]HAY41809.1 hypothetical protein [Gammaproteobacteria bacterium]